MKHTIETKLSPRYLRGVESMTFTATGVKVEFKNAPSYEGDLEGLKEHMRRTKAVFKHSQVDGKKVAIFPAFIPSNKEQRQVLAQVTGAESVDGKAYTFATKFKANEFAQALSAAGVKHYPKNWDYGIVREQDQLPL